MGFTKTSDPRKSSSSIRLKGAELCSPTVNRAELSEEDACMPLPNPLGRPGRRQCGPNRRLSHFVSGLADNRDQGEGRQRQELIQNTEKRSESVQNFDLPESEGTPAQKARVQPPRDYANSIEFQQVLQMKSGLFHQIRQLLSSVATVMTEHLIKRAKKPGAAGNKNDGAAAIFEHFTKIAECPMVVRQVFDHVQANHRVEFLLLGKGFAFFPVRVANFHVRAVQFDFLQII